MEFVIGQWFNNYNPKANLKLYECLNKRNEKKKNKKKWITIEYMSGKELCKIIPCENEIDTIGELKKYVVKKTKRNYELYINNEKLKKLVDMSLKLKDINESIFVIILDPKLIKLTSDNTSILEIIKIIKNAGHSQFDIDINNNNITDESICKLGNVHTLTLSYLPKITDESICKLGNVHTLSLYNLDITDESICKLGNVHTLTLNGKCVRK